MAIVSIVGRLWSFVGTFVPAGRPEPVPLALNSRIKFVLLVVLGLAVLLAAIVSAFPVGWLKTAAEHQLSGKLGTRVQIGALDREEAFTLSPVIRLTGIEVAQPAWEGRGSLASIRLVRLRVHFLPLLAGRLDAELLAVRGGSLSLLRAADGRENWRNDSGPRNGQGAGLDLSGIAISDIVIHYDDARQNRSAVVTANIDPKVGLVLHGAGMVDGTPVQMAVSGGALIPNRAWPFQAQVEGPSLSIRLAGTAAEPLRFEDMKFHVAARADDLQRIDRVIEAGLFGTQPVDLQADVEHKNDSWSVTQLVGTVGLSQLRAHVIAHKTSGPTKIDGDIRFAQLNFDDLATSRGLGKARALEKVEGPRIVPNTRINILKVKAEGRLTVKADRIVGGKRPSSITSASATFLVKDHVLNVDDLRLGFRQGAIAGKAVVDQRSERSKPKLSLALDLQNSSTTALGGVEAGTAEARVDGRLRLAGIGDTIREAVGSSSGTIAVVARAGQLPSKTAALMGFDIGKVLTASKKRMVALRCGIIRLDVRNGRGNVDPLLIDTSVSQMHGIGTIAFPAETLDIRLSGAPKTGATLRLPGTVRAVGTLRSLKIEVPEPTKSVSSLLKIVKGAVSGEHAALASDANCAVLIATATSF